MSEKLDPTQFDHDGKRNTFSLRKKEYVKHSLPKILNMMREGLDLLQ